MTSRLRKFDKSILSQTIDFDNDDNDDDGQLLDTQDQINLIDKLTISNREIFKRYIRYLSIFYIFQICLLSIIQIIKKSKDLSYLLFTLSILLNLIMVNYTQYNKVIKILSVFISLQLTYIGYFLRREEMLLLCVVPWFNTITPYVFTYWFTNMNNLVEELNKLKYEYKNV